MAIDMDKLQEFLGRFVTDLGATFAAGNVVTGHRLGLYRALATGSASPEELARAGHLRAERQLLRPPVELQRGLRHPEPCSAATRCST